VFNCFISGLAYCLQSVFNCLLAQWTTGLPYALMYLCALVFSRAALYICNLWTTVSASLCIVVFLTSDYIFAIEHAILLHTGKPDGDPKPDGCGCEIPPAGAVTGGFGHISRVWSWAGFCSTQPESDSLPSLIL
jgi:hypothetical protein